MPSLSELLDRHGVLVADGATGTNSPEHGHPGRRLTRGVAVLGRRRWGELHRQFAAAGSDLALTCSFGATAPRLADGPLAGRAREVNVRAAEIAREAVGAERLVGGSMGPTGQLVEPFGLLTHDDAVAAYAEQAAALVEGGVDLLVLETFFALEEALWAAEGIRSVTELPLIVSFSFDQGTRTMMGLSPADVVAAIEPLEPAALGANCGRSLEENATVVSEFLDAGLSVPLWIKPNAGVPRIVADAVVYGADPATMAERIRGFVEQGARIVGGCCGSTPEHVAAIAEAVHATAARH